MQLSKKITRQIKDIPEEKTFGYADLDIPWEQYQSAAKVMERLQKKGVVKKLSKGVFYKPRKTVFGETTPSDTEQLRPYLFEDGKRIAYITGTFLYNQMGLTRQMAFRAKVASRKKRIYINTDTLRATPVKSYVDVTDENFEMLGILDAMKDLRSIPDVETRAAINIFSRLIERFNPGQIKELVTCALFYPPRVRSLLGALLENCEEIIWLDKLKNTLNPLSTYKYGISPKILPTINQWRIV
jgi:hypothetical protein